MLFLGLSIETGKERYRPPMGGVKTSSGLKVGGGQHPCILRTPSFLRTGKGDYGKCKNSYFLSIQKNLVHFGFGW